MLRTLLQDEDLRLRKAKDQAGAASAPIDGGGSLESDELTLRLTLVRSLLKARRDNDAATEAEVAAIKFPGSTAALLWHARCLLRKVPTLVLPSVVYANERTNERTPIFPVALFSSSRETLDVCEI